MYITTNIILLLLLLLVVAVVVQMAVSYIPMQVIMTDKKMILDSGEPENRRRIERPFNYISIQTSIGDQ